MSSQSFADLGVSRAVVRALAERGITEPFAIQKLVIADVLAGHDVLAKSPTGSGKTLAFGVPIADRIEAERPPPRGAGPRPDPRARLADRRGAAPDRPRPRAEDRRRLRRRRHREAGRARPRTPTSSSPRPAASRTCSQRGAFTLDHVRMLVLDEADRMLDMGFRPAVDRIVGPVPARAPDAVLLGHARGRGRPRRQALHARRAAPRARPDGHAHEPRSSTASSPSSATTASTRCVGELRARPRARARVRAHQARRRPAGQAPQPRGRRRRRDARRQVPAPARAGAGQLRARPRRHARGHRRRRPRHRRATASRTSSTSIRPRTATATCTAIGRTGRAGRTGVGITFVGAEQARDVEKIAAELQLQREFAGSGLSLGHAGRGAPGGDRARGRVRRSRSRGAAERLGGEAGAGRTR